LPAETLTTLTLGSAMAFGVLESSRPSANFVLLVPASSVEWRTVVSPYMTLYANTHTRILYYHGNVAKRNMATTKGGGGHQNFFDGDDHRHDEVSIISEGLL